jgi:hypothetical protein
MPSLDLVERQIALFEGFNVRFKTKGRDVRGDKRKGVKGYRGLFLRKARETMSVESFKRLRMARFYGGYEVEVLYASGKPAPGKTFLGTVRKAYESNE